MVNAILVDDHALFRLGVKMALTSGHTDINIIGEADCGRELFRLLETVTPDIILLDIILPDTTGIEIAKKLRKEKPGIKILAISAENTSDVVKKMLDIGIEGFISKRKGSADEIAKAIRTIMNGHQYYGDDISVIIYKVYVSKKKTKEKLIRLSMNIPYYALFRFFEKVFERHVFYRDRVVYRKFNPVSYA